MSGYQHLTPVGEGSTHILTYNPASGFTHISDISDQLKKTLILSHMSQSKVYIYLILTISFQIQRHIKDHNIE